MKATHMITQRPLVVAAIFAGVLMSACVPIRQEASWPALSVLGADQNIAVAFFDRITLVDPEDGTPVKLRNADGEVRVDDQGNARIWELTGPDNPPSQFYSSPVPVSEETVLVAAYTEQLFEVDLTTARITNETGVKLVGPVVATPVVNGDLLYIGITEHDLVALDPVSKAERWRFETGHGVWSQPLVIDDVLYFSALDHFLYALNAETGEELWRLDLQGAAPEAPVYYEGRLYTGSFARKLFEISLDGEVLAEFPTKDWVWSTPAIVDGVLYAGDLSGTVYALDVADGGFSPLWQAQVAARAIRTTPLVRDEYVIVGSRDHKVYWLNREDGSTFFFREVAGEVLSDLLVIEPSETVDIAEPLVVVGTPTLQELLVAFSVQNGERVWSYGR